MKQVALQLFHGRKSKKEDLDTWGTRGPVFIVDYVHVTYQFGIKLGVPEPAGDGDLHLVDDLVYYDGVYYGDWSVFPASMIQANDSIRSRVTTYDAEKARLPVPTP